MTLDVERTPIKVNKILGKRASIGPIPADQLVPWVILGCLSYFLVKGLLALSYPIWLITWVWLAASWWALTGEKTYAYLKSWVMPPGADWINGETLFIRASEPGTWEHMRRDRMPYIEEHTEQGVKRFAPFQNFNHLHSILEVQMGGHRFAALVLYNKFKNQWTAHIPFLLNGLHPYLYREEIETQFQSLSSAFGELPLNEYLTFHLICTGYDRQRRQQLQALAEDSPSNAISVFLLNEQRRTQELAQQGIRQRWRQVVWGSWTADTSEADERDLIGRILLWFQNRYQRSLRSFMGTEQAHFDNFYTELARKVYEHGYLRWRNLLETKADLACQPMTAQELWEDLWYRFNLRPAPKLPESQYIRVIEEKGGLQQSVPISGQRDLMTVLIQGDRGRSSCPRHKKQRGYFYASGKVGKAVVIETPPEMWVNAREQLRWIYTRFATSYVHDTEMVVQITPKERWTTQDELLKMTRQAQTENRRAELFATGRQVEGTLQREQAENALRKLLEGHCPILVAPVFLVWRETEAAADEAARQLCNIFGAAEVVSEEDIAWRIYCESLPTNDSPLLQKYAAFSERRITLDSETVSGFLPLTRERDLDQRGVEFICESGHPIYVDPLDSRTGRILITGKTGSGKSVLGWRFIQEALAQKVPVVGLDLSAGGDSTFKTALAMLGEEKAAYIDILRDSLNLMEPPDLRGIPTRLKVQRLKRWKDILRSAIVAIAMGQVHDPQLQDRVDTVTLRLLDVFFGDADIIRRYNQAFEKGWKSEAWQAIPTLHDLLQFCSKEKLNLDSYGDLDARAINQIVNQIQAKLIDPNIGNVLGQPSSVSPSPLIKFYALSGLTNEHNSSIMAISAQMACLRNALASPRSLFVGDELSVLLDKPGFANLIGELLATGRKEGVSVLMLMQDIDAVVQCSARAKILANLGTIITGFTTHGAISTYTEVLNYDPRLIGTTATERFASNPHELYTKWLIERSGRFWETRFYAAPMMLAALANSQDEAIARERVLAAYPKTEAGYLKGLRDFTDQYLEYVRGSKRLSEIEATTTLMSPSHMQLVMS